MTNNDPITVYVEPYEQVVANFIKEDSQRLVDASIFWALQDVEPYNLIRSTRAILANLKREGKRPSPQMTAMLYKVDERKENFYLDPDLGKIALHYGYKMMIHSSTKRGEKYTVGPIHHRGSVFGRLGDLRTKAALDRLALTSQYVYSPKKKAGKKP